MKWYLQFEGFILCHKGTQEPKPFDSREDCQQWIDNNCDPHEFPTVDFVQTDDIEELRRYAQSQKRGES